MTKKQTIIFVLAVLLLQSCASAPVFNVAVSSLASYEGIQDYKTFTLLPKDSSISIDDLQFKEYANYIKKILAAKNLKQTSSDKADLIILLDYGIGEPKKHTYTGYVPIYGKTGVSSSTTTGTVTDTVYGSSTGTVYGSSKISAHTTYTPSYGIVGSQAYTGSYTTYDRYLSILAYDANKFRNKKYKQIWVTSATSTGSSGDMRRVFPIMLAAMDPHLMTNTGKNINLTLSETSDAVKALKGELPPKQ